MTIRPMSRLALEPIMLKMPDFSLRKPESFKTNLTEVKGSPQNLIESIEDRFPWQPPFPVQHPALKNLRDYLKLLIAESPAEFLQTDEIFHRKSHDQAVKKDILQRWWARWLHEKRVAFTVAEEMIYKEILRLEERFAKSKAIAEERSQRQFLERIKVLERFVRSRDFRWKIQVEWAENRTELIKQGFIEAERIWDWRQANLFTLSDTGLVARLPFQGRPLENVLGELHHKKILANLEETHIWRFDTKYTTLPNGGVTQIKNGGGQTKEHVDDLIKRPIVDKRTDGFRVWHQSGFKIESPNHVPMTAPNLQGHSPELISAEIQKPTIDQRVEGHQNYHKSGKMISLPNQSMTKSPESGQPIEVVTAETYWPKRSEATTLAKDWGESLKFTVMTNGSYGRLATVGDAKEKVIGDLGEKINLRQKNYFEKEFIQSDYATTPNGGYSPLMNSGNKIEVVSGDQATNLAQQRSRNHLLWLWTGKHLAPTAQGSGNLDQLDLTPGVLADQKNHQAENSRLFTGKAAQKERVEEIVEKKSFESPSLKTSPLKESPAVIPSTVSLSADEQAKAPVKETPREIPRETPLSAGSQTHRGQEPFRLDDLSPRASTDEPPKAARADPTKPDAVQELPVPARKDKALKAFQSSLERDGTALAGRLQGHVGELVQNQAMSGVRHQSLGDQQSQKVEVPSLKNKIS